jgi:hypothetical protein
MAESAVSFNTSETKLQFRQWLPKGQPGPVKAKVHATRNKQMYQLCAQVNASYILEALGTFMKILSKKRPEMVAGDWMFH